MSYIRNILGRVSLPVLVATLLAGAAVGGPSRLALYLLSFLYYGLYWRAFAWGVASFESFKREAMVLKALSVAVLGIVYLQSPLDPLSLGVIAAGVLLNAWAASILGIDRTYYGTEVSGLEALRVTAFPYSLLDHPMIVGNVLAFGGTLINPAFREAWWPLASIHVGLNLALLAMESAGPRRRQSVRIGGVFVLSLTAVATTAAGLATRSHAADGPDSLLIQGWKLT